jgi:hypothetical protein
MWKGDQVAACVAAASVIAKVTRDALMCDLDKVFPDYGFARHKGYSTRSHMRALDAHGPCAEHRKSFVNVRGRLVGEPDSSADDLVASPADLLDSPGELLDGPGELLDGPGELAGANPEVELPSRADRPVGRANSEPANSCDVAGTGQNGPIVDIIEEHGWPTAGIAAVARGA